MNKSILTLLSLSLGLITCTAHALYGARICDNPGFHCYTVEAGDNWFNLFPDDGERDLVRRLNRMNIRLPIGTVIAIPDNLSSVSIMDISPFPSQINPPGRSLIKVNLSKLAWGAYDSSGDLVRWGPASGGKDYCPDIKRGCRTVSGQFTVYSEQGPGCVSSVYPRPRGGAPMPYCMHFFKGYALHGSASVPGQNASHGCVRLFVEDAQWLNQDFVNPGSTKVIVTR